MDIVLFLIARAADLQTCGRMRRLSKEVTSIINMPVTYIDHKLSHICAREYKMGGATYYGIVDTIFPSDYAGIFVLDIHVNGIPTRTAFNIINGIGHGYCGTDESSFLIWTSSHPERTQLIQIINYQIGHQKLEIYNGIKYSSNHKVLIEILSRDNRYELLLDPTFQEWLKKELI